METVDGKKVGYLRLPQFTRGSADALSDAVKRLRAKGAQALVLRPARRPRRARDRGGRGGGGLPAVRHAGRDHRGPALAAARRSRPAATRRPATCRWSSWWTRTARAPARSWRGRCATPTGPCWWATAPSARPWCRRSRQLRDGGALKFTIARYLTPDGYDLAKRGLPPDVKVTDDPAHAARRGAAAGPAPGPRGRPAEPAGRLASRCSSRELVSAGPRRGGPAGLRARARAIPLAKGARDGAEVGDLVTVTMRGRAGRVTAVHGPARSPRAALRALLAAEGLGTALPARRPRGGRGAGRRTPPAPRPRAPRPARPAGHHDRPRGRQGPRRRHRRRRPRAPAPPACGSTSPTSPASSRPAGALDREAARRGTRSTCPGRSTRCCPRACPRTSAACGPASTARRSRWRWSSTPTARSARPASRAR